MECYSEQTCASPWMANWRPTSPAPARPPDHVSALRALVDALRAENRVLSESLNELPEETASRRASPLSAGPGGGATWRSWRWCWC